MYEAEGETACTLHPETLRRMREAFAGEGCTACGVPAARLCAGQFFCHKHHPEAKKVSRAPRIYRCTVATEA
jgi:hypothetical protein